MQEISNKKFFKNYAFFILILLVMFSILSYFIIISRKSWNNNLAITVQKVLDEKESNRWKVGEHIEINAPVTVNCAAYKLSDTKDNSEKTAIIIRIVNYYGPIPAVYIYNDNDGSVDFIGYSSLHGRIQTQLMSNKSDKRREYWQESIPSILGK
jgi:hypothetical protein